MRVLPRGRLAKLFRDAGVAPGDTVVTYCHIGQQATAVLLAARLLGHPVRLYDGSFEDWARRGLPTETGRAREAWGVGRKPPTAYVRGHSSSPGFPFPC